MRILKNGLFAAAICVGSTGMAEAQSFGFATFSAEVQANGVTARGSGVKASIRAGLGIYAISFMRDVTVCSIVASPSGQQGGQASVVKSAKNPDRIRIYTFSRTGQRANLSFAVVASCAS